MTVAEWRWVKDTVIFAIHDRQIAEHGGSSGIRDRGAIESALARPQNRVAHANPDAAELAAAYAYALVKNHGFVDGNKRIGWIAARLFLADNGLQLDYQPLEAIRLMNQLADGEMSEADLRSWLHKRLRPLPNPE